MAEDGFKRKLTAILSADVAGYSKLMAEDEASTVKILPATEKLSPRCQSNIMAG